MSSRIGVLVSDGLAHVSRETKLSRSLSVHVQCEKYLETGPRYLRVGVLLGDCCARVSRETDSNRPLSTKCNAIGFETRPLDMCWSARRSEAIGVMFHVKREPSDALIIMCNAM